MTHKLSLQLLAAAVLIIGLCTGAQALEYTVQHSLDKGRTWSDWGFVDGEPVREAESGGLHLESRCSMGVHVRAEDCVPNKHADLEHFQTLQGSATVFIRNTPSAQVQAKLAQLVKDDG